MALLTTMESISREYLVLGRSLHETITAIVIRAARKDIMVRMILVWRMMELSRGERGDTSVI